METTMNKIDTARKAVTISDWLSRPAKERATEHQAAVFALQKAAEHGGGGRDIYHQVMGWISGHIGKP
jgi:hypothetical protein